MKEITTINKKISGIKGPETNATGNNKIKIELKFTKFFFKLPIKHILLIAVFNK